MPIDQTAGAAPIFLGPPLITVDADTAGDVACSDATMHALRNRLYELDPTAPCASVGSVGTETITCGFWNGKTQFSRSLDCVFILGMNLVRFKVEYSNDNGANYTTVLGSDYSAIDYAGGPSFVLFLAVPITANKLRLSMYDATDKIVGTFDCALATLQPDGRPMSAFDPAIIQARKEIRLPDGTRDVTYIYWSDNSFTLTEYACEHDFISRADKLRFDALFGSPEPFLFMPEPGDDAGVVVLSQLKLGSYVPKYQTAWKGSGFKIRYTTEPLGHG